MTCQPFLDGCGGFDLPPTACTSSAVLANQVLDESITVLAELLCPGSDCTDSFDAYICGGQPVPPLGRPALAIWMASFSTTATTFGQTGLQAIPVGIQPAPVVSAQLILGPLDLGQWVDRPQGDAADWYPPDFGRLTEASTLAVSIAETWWRRLAMAMVTEDTGLQMGPLTAAPFQGPYASWGLTVRTT